MVKIALDIVLIPPREIILEIENIVKKANEKGQAEHLMSENDFIPHISLAMGCTEKENIEEIFERVRQITKDFTPINIKLTELKYVESSEGKKTYFLSIDKNDELQKLHESIMNSVEEFLSYDPTPEMYFRKKGEKVDKVSKGIPMFKERSRDRYNPHITILVHETDFDDLPIEFLASRIALCHVGIRTSCRKILSEEELRG